MEKEEFLLLIERIRKGEASDGDIALYNRWFASFQQSTLWNEIEQGEPEQIKNMIAGRIERQITRLEDTTPPPRVWPRIVAAASVLICCALGYYYFRPQPRQQYTQVALMIKPGGNKAVLTLAGGRRINLSDAGKGRLANEAGVAITKDKNGQITYTAEGTGQEVQYNTTATPKGGQWHLVLQDGTQVWLNAASSLRYPTAFNGAERQVELNGEGYFEVAKDKAHPFIVHTANETVRVLGTHFNINAYSDEPATRTTLLEGSVKVNDTFIKPGEQSILSTSGIKVTTTDVEEAVAWKNDLFVFQQENLQSVMRKLARWYNVEVIYEQSINDKTFTGTIGRFDDISKILNKITFTSGVHFKAEGRRITVSR